MRGDAGQYKPPADESAAVFYFPAIYRFIA